MIQHVAAVLIVFGIAFLLWKKETTSLRKVFWPALLLKLVSGIALGLIYRYYYRTGDTLEYYTQAVQAVSTFREDPGLFISSLFGATPGADLFDGAAPRAVFFARLVTVFMLLSGPDYNVLSMLFSFTSFVAAWWLVKELAYFRPSLQLPAVFAFLFFPSVVFWTSGVIKESIAFTCICIVTVFFVRLLPKRRIAYGLWVSVLPCLWLLWNTKYYYLALLVPVMLTHLIFVFFAEPRLTHRSMLLKVFTWCLLFSIPVAIATLIHPNFYPSRFLHVISENYDAFHSISGRGDVVTYPGLKPEPISMLRNAPAAVVAALYRPFLWEVNAAFKIPAAIENLVLLVLTISALAYRWNRRADEGSAHTVPLVVYVLLLAAFLALSTPNLGTLSRYRVGFLPFFVLLICTENPLFGSAVAIFRKMFAGVWEKT